MGEGIAGEARILLRRDGVVVRGPVEVVRRLAAGAEADLRPGKVVKEELLDLVREGDVGRLGELVLRVGEVRDVLPVRGTDVALQSERATRGVGGVLVVLLAEVTDFLGREDALQVQVLPRSRRRVFEVVQRARGAVRAAVEARAGVEARDLVAQQQVSEELDARVDVVVQVHVALGVLLAVADGVEPGALGSAVVARATIAGGAAAGARLLARRAAELPGRVRAAAGRVEELVVGVAEVVGVADHQPVTLGDGREIGVAVEVLVGLGALVAPDRVDGLVLGAQNAREPPGRETVSQAEAQLVAAAVLGPAVAHVGLQAVHLLAQVDVHHARDRVRAVNRGLAARQDVDLVDQHRRDAADAGDDVGAVVQRRVVGNRSPVDQELGVTGREAEQAQGLGARGEAVDELRALDGAGCERGVLQGIGHRGEALLLDVLRGDRGHGLRRFLLHLRNQRSGDHHFLQFFGGGRGGSIGRHGGTCSNRAQRYGCTGQRRHEGV
jgi:hypothetical protein